jgi:hypothetical protein
MITDPTRLIFIILSILFISSCGDAFIGELTVHQAIGFTDKGDEAVTLSSGAYRTELRFNESASTFELKVTDAEKHTRTLNLSASENVRLPGRHRPSPENIHLPGSVYPGVVLINIKFIF